MQRPTPFNCTFSSSGKLTSCGLGCGVEAEEASSHNRLISPMAIYNFLLVAGDNLNLNAPFLTIGVQTIRVFNPNTQKYAVVAEMDRGRWYPSVMTMADGNLLILGGMQQVSSTNFLRVFTVKFSQ